MHRYHTWPASANIEHRFIHHSQTYCSYNQSSQTQGNHKFTHIIGTTTSHTNSFTSDITNLLSTRELQATTEVPSKRRNKLSSSVTCVDVQDALK